MALVRIMGAPVMHPFSQGFDGLNPMKLRHSKERFVVWLPFFRHHHRAPAAVMAAVTSAPPEGSNLALCHPARHQCLQKVFGQNAESIDTMEHQVRHHKVFQTGSLDLRTDWQS